MSGRRKGPQKRQQTSSQALLWTVSVVALILTLCLCVFNLDWSGTKHTRLDTCRSTCDERLQSAALDSTVSASLSPIATSTLFLGSRGVDKKSGVQGGSSAQSSDGSNRAPTQPQAALTGRPRRLPTLIKILTGFGDEPYWNDQSSNNSGSSDSASGKNNKPIIARIEMPNFVQQAQQRRRNTSAEHLSHEDTVQAAAAAAAAAVWSKSIRIYCNTRMLRVNSEWDAALRWIAGWDQQHHQMRSNGNGSEPANRANDNAPSNGGAANEMSQEGFNNFVDDLARMLDTCIRECVEDENFESRMRNEGSGEVTLSSSIGDMILRSFFVWFIGSTFPNVSFGKLDMISSESRVVIARAFHLVASSAAVYALHSLWGWAAPVLSSWYSSFGYSETPEWLVEHEKEIQQAKSSSRSKQKKKSRRRQQTKNSGSRTKSAPCKGGLHTEIPASRETAGTDDIVPNSTTLETKKAGSHQIKEQREEHLSEKAMHTTKDSVSGSQGSSTTEDIPSLISYQTTSVTSSPSMKPIGRDRDIPYGSLLRDSPQPGLGFNSQRISQGTPLFPQLPTQPGALPVPTQEQRNEAAKQLREFQNAQLQRLLLHRKLSQQSSNVSRLSAASAVPQAPTLLSCTTSNSLGNNPAVDSSSSQQQCNILRPPPGLSLPSETNHNTDLHGQLDDKGFLTDNELFLARLLDDDDDFKEDTPSPQTEIQSMAPESSLDPAAAPFVSGKVDGAGDQLLFPKMRQEKEEKKDTWESNPGVVLQQSNPSRMIKGVYGGSVW